MRPLPVVSSGLRHVWDRVEKLYAVTVDDKWVKLIYRHRSFIHGINAWIQVSEAIPASDFTTVNDISKATICVTEEDVNAILRRLSVRQWRNTQVFLARRRSEITVMECNWPQFHR